MSSTPTNINRRRFLKVGAAFALMPATVRGQVPIERGRFSEDYLPLVRQQLLDLVNTERKQAGLSQLQLDDLACNVANDHARDMANRRFLSHWGSDGRKPYQRYSFAGGVDAIQENVSAADNILSLTPNGVAGDLRDMHTTMHAETPPSDGHRRAILFPQHTHVGFGIGLMNRYLRLDELYLSRYVQVDPVPSPARIKTKLLVSGRLLRPNDLLNSLEVYYEPLPSPPAIEWLRVPRSYGLPEVSERLRPRLPDILFYPEGGHGSIDIDSKNRFRVRVNLSKEPGINTIVVLIKAGRTGTSFPAAQMCIRVE